MGCLYLGSPFFREPLCEKPVNCLLWIAWEEKTECHKRPDSTIPCPWDGTETLIYSAS